VGQGHRVRGLADKVKAMTDEEARAMSVTGDVMDLVRKSRTEVVLSSPYFIPGEMGVTELATW
jgi:hypothetical protein